MSHVGRLLVLYPAISSFAQTEFARPSREGIAEFFSHDDISVDKLQSRLVPRYKVLSEEDICVLEKRLKLSRHKLPIMLRADAMCHYLGFRKNNVIMAIDYNTFRIVK
jgi:DNA-directed RNA polymerase subunit H (RpoH/RPB5)